LHSGAQVVLTVRCHLDGDGDQLAGSVVRKLQLSREPGPQARVGVQERVHELRVSSADHDETTTVVFHPLEQRLDCLGPKVMTNHIGRRQGIGLVDEQNTVQGIAHRFVGLYRSVAHVLADQPSTVNLDQVAFLEQPHRPVCLGEQAGHRGLAGSGIAEKHQVLTDRHIDQAMLASLGLDLQKCQQRPDLFLHALQPNEGIEVGLNLTQRPRRTNALRWARPTATLAEEVLCIASGEIACFEEAFADVVFTGDEVKLLAGRVCNRRRVLDPYFDLTGKIALVTGGSRGMGYQMVKAFAERGADCIIASRKLDNCEAVAEEVKALGRRALAVQVHAAKWPSIDALIETAYAEFGRIDILVNNAGMSPAMPSHLVTEDLFDSVIGLNFKGPFRLASQVAKRMSEADGGVIINVTSSGSLLPLPMVVPYSSAKAALNAMTRSLAAEYGPRVRINTLSPGPFLTDIADAWTTQQRERADNALGRPGRPEEIITAALFLASPASSFTNGALIRVDGGMPIGQ
jgi:NAD(P)-dependent dehydrogenase (short-subunit alcohol dehydrogenase family)